MAMTDEKTIKIRGEWHAHWVDMELTYDLLCKDSWQTLLGSDLKVLRRADAAKTLQEWVEWMMKDESLSP